MLSRRLESGLSTDELRIILCNVTMRNTRFTWAGGGEGLGRLAPGHDSAWTPSFRASSAGGPAPRCWDDRAHGLTEQELKSSPWTDGPRCWSSTNLLCS